MIPVEVAEHVEWLHGRILWTVAEVGPMTFECSDELIYNLVRKHSVRQLNSPCGSTVESLNVVGIIVNIFWAISNAENEDPRDVPKLFRTNKTMNRLL